MSIYEILQIVFYCLAGVALLALLIYLFISKKMKIRQKIFFVFVLVLSFAQTIIYTIMSIFGSSNNEIN